MKLVSALLLALTLSSLAGQAHAKRNCTTFWANLVGLEAALQECNPTPNFNAWVKEERVRIAEEERVRQEEAKNPKTTDVVPAGKTGGAADTGK